MVQPIQYLPPPADPFVRATQGLKIGEAIRGIRERMAEESEADMYKRDLKDAMDRGDPNAFAQLAAKYPDQAKSIKSSWEMLKPGQQQAELLAGAEAYNAIKNNQPQVAKTILDQRISAARNSGQDTSRLESIRNTLDADPTVVPKQLDMIMYAIAPEQWGKMTGGSTNVQVQSSQILPDGTTVVVTKTGETQVRNPQGDIVTGQQAAEAINQAQSVGVGLKGREAVRKEALTDAQGIATKTFEQIPNIKGNLRNLDAAANLVKQGANTGVIANRFPDWNASTIALRNVQNQLGLDVVGSVTFGALSESELNLALQTGLPTNLDQPDLLKWIQDKKTAQNKLLDYLNEQAEFLSREDTTLNDWLKKVGGSRSQSPQIPANLKNKSYMNVVTGNP